MDVKHNLVFYLLGKAVFPAKVENGHFNFSLEDKDKYIEGVVHNFKKDNFYFKESDGKLGVIRPTTGQFLNIQYNINQNVKLSQANNVLWGYRTNESNKELYGVVINGDKVIEKKLELGVEPPTNIKANYVANNGKMLIGVETYKEGNTKTNFLIYTVDKNGNQNPIDKGNFDLDYYHTHRQYMNLSEKDGNLEYVYVARTEEEGYKYYDEIRFGNDKVGRYFTIKIKGLFGNTEYTINRIDNSTEVLWDKGKTLSLLIMDNRKLGLPPTIGIAKEQIFYVNVGQKQFFLSGVGGYLTLYGDVKFPLPHPALLECDYLVIPNQDTKTVKITDIFEGKVENADVIPFKEFVKFKEKILKKYGGDKYSTMVGVDKFLYFIDYSGRLVGLRLTPNPSKKQQKYIFNFKTKRIEVPEEFNEIEIVKTEDVALVISNKGNPYLITLHYHHYKKDYFVNLYRIDTKTGKLESVYKEMMVDIKDKNERYYYFKHIEVFEVGDTPYIIMQRSDDSIHLLGVKYALNKTTLENYVKKEHKGLYDFVFTDDFFQKPQRITIDISSSKNISPIEEIKRILKHIENENGNFYHIGGNFIYAEKGKIYKLTDELLNSLFVSYLNYKGKNLAVIVNEKGYPERIYFNLEAGTLFNVC